MHHFTRLKTILRHYIYVVPPYCLSPKSLSIILTIDQRATGSWEFVLLHQVLFQIRKASKYSQGLLFIYIYLYLAELDWLEKTDIYIDIQIYMANRAIINLCQAQVKTSFCALISRPQHLSYILLNEFFTSKAHPGLLENPIPTEVSVDEMTSKCHRNKRILRDFYRDITSEGGARHH